MKQFNQLLAMTATVLCLSLGNGQLAAQPGPGRGNFDPEQFRQRMMDRYKEALEVKSDDEWKIISERIEKVTTAQREVRMGGFAAFGGRRGGGGGNGDGPDNGGRRNRFGGEPGPEAQALQKALDAKASSDELKSKLARVREAQKEKEAKLATAQEDLRKVLSLRQEATAVLMGLLK